MNRIDTIKVAVATFLYVCLVLIAIFFIDTKIIEVFSIFVVSMVFIEYILDILTSDYSAPESIS
jgi:hypothetical protein